MAKSVAATEMIDQSRLISTPQSGLTQACQSSPYSREYVEKAVVEYIKKWVPQRRVGVLAGNSVHADRGFLVEEMPEIMEWLHYRFLLSPFSVIRDI